MEIQSVTTIAAQPPAPPAAAAAPVAAAAPPETSNAPAQDAGAPPVEMKKIEIPIPPVETIGDPHDFAIAIGRDEATNSDVYSVVHAPSGDTVVTIPPQGVLDLVAAVLQRLMEDGRA